MYKIEYESSINVPNLHKINGLEKTLTHIQNMASSLGAKYVSMDKQDLIEYLTVELI